MTRSVLLLGLLLVVLGAACAPLQSNSPSRASTRSSEPAAGSSGLQLGSAEDRALPAAAPGAAANESATSMPLPGLDRMIVRTVTLALAVGNVEEAQREVERIALETGGLVAGSRARQEGNRQVATITIRVPADGGTYAATMERLRGLADQVLDEQVQTQDVTEEYVDLEARLRALRLTEERLLALFERANTVEEVINVQRELTTVRGQIEQAEGRRLALERRAALTTITVSLRGAPVTRLHADWSPAGVVVEAWRAFTVALRGLGTLLIWALIWLPLYGLPLLVIWLLRGRLGGRLGGRLRAAGRG